MGYLLPQEGQARKVRTVAGVPSAGTSEVQTLTIGGTPDGGSFKLDFKGQITAPIVWTATDATLVSRVDAALGALSTIGGASNVTTAAGTVSSGIGTITITFAAALAKLNVPLITVSSNDLTGTSPTVAVATTTAGVTATHRGAPTGALLIDTTNGIEYYNTGTVYAPTWTATDGTLSATYLADITPGTVAASKTVIVDSNKDASAFRNVTATNYDAGASGTAGSVDVFPTTASKGKTAFTATDNSGNTTTTINTAAQAAARAYSVPDALADADFLMGKQAAVARTATADGLTTGTIAAAGMHQHITVTSADANHIIVLPTPTPGTQVVLDVGANGFELRSSAPTTVLINGGTGGAAVESAIPANSTVFMTCVSATSWKGFFMDADGDVAKVEAAA